MAASHYDIDYFRHVLRTVDGSQLGQEDIVAILDLLYSALAENSGAARLNRVCS